MAFDKNQPAYLALRGIITERTQNFFAWVGSGISAEVGLPTWPRLRKVLLDTLMRKAQSVQEPDKTHLISQHDEILRLNNNWMIFQRLKNILGQTTYRDTIKDQMTIANTSKVPEIYTYLWKLRIRGLLNLNLDRLATKAKMLLNPESTLIEFNGKSVAGFIHALQSPKPFIANLHGIVDDYNSWVFTKEDLKELLAIEAYQTFIKSCLATSTILFLGISADDVAVGGFLEDFNTMNIQLGTHYWITNRCDTETDKWAESVGIRIIRYDNKNGDFSPLKEIFDDLLNFIPKEEIAPPVVPSISKNEYLEFLNPNELLKYEAEDIRIVLNARAKEILSDSSEESYKKYEQFCREFDQAIYRAWYTSDKAGQNKLLGYTLLKDKAKGAFGKVYLAKDEKNNDVAVKVLIEDERHRPEFLQSFRRGVRSMRILADHKVERMVGYKDAYEIPAFVVMDWIDGPNLADAVRAEHIDDWFSILKISTQIVATIEIAHRLPERVLHRDLRPPNIMLKNFYTDKINWEVVILDFDLSWHMGASENSIISGSTATGYLAPEQIQRIKNISTRHSAVDSFGIGMTLFFIISTRDPIPEEHQHANWYKSVSESANNHVSTNWKSLPTRFSRLIMNCTKHNQSDRWDLGQIKGELFRLKSAIDRPADVESAELIAEEIIVRTTYKDYYSWNCDSMMASIKLPSGIIITLKGDESYKKVRLELNWVSKGLDVNKKINKWLPKASEKTQKELYRVGWKNDSVNFSGKSLKIKSTVSTDYAISHLDELANSINEIGNYLNLV